MCVWGGGGVGVHALFHNIATVVVKLACLQVLLHTDPGARDGVRAESPTNVDLCEAFNAKMAVECPEALALDVQPTHVLGMDLEACSMAQLEALEIIHRNALARCVNSSAFQHLLWL